MVDKKIFDKRKIESITIVDRKRCEIFTWKDHSKTIWDEFQEGFYYDTGAKKFLSAEELEIGMFKDTEFIVEGTRVYYKPYTKLRTVSGDEEYWYFNSYHEATEKGHELLNEFLDKEHALIIEGPRFEDVEKPKWYYGEIE